MTRSIAFLCLLCLVDGAWGNTLRCGGDIVSEGDSALALRGRCGEPAQVDRYENRTPIERYDRVLGRYVLEYASDPYEIWTYNFGPRRFITRVTVRKGIVKGIETGGYGF
jgi:hypothetical protein